MKVFEEKSYYGYDDETNAEYSKGMATLLGKTLSSIDKTEDEMTLITTDGESYRFYHDQDCCECVRIEDVCGDLLDLLHTPITLSEYVTSTEDGDDSTWTFYKFATNKGSVTVRWLGTSNGYYSEKVSLSTKTLKDSAVAKEPRSVEWENYFALQRRVDEYKEALHAANRQLDEAYDLLRTTGQLT